MIIKSTLPPGIAHRIRRAIRNRFKRNMWRHLPYTPTQLAKHLEKQFQEGMTWKNYGCARGCWNIDHIYPISRLGHPRNPCHPDFKKCWSLKNLQPMWMEENVAKGDSIPDE